MEPVWRGDGRELFTWDSTARSWPVNVTGGAGSDERAAALFKPGVPRGFCIEPTHAVARRPPILVTTFTEEPKTLPTKIFFNWRASISRRCTPGLSPQASSL